MVSSGGRGGAPDALRFLLCDLYCLFETCPCTNVVHFSPSGSKLGVCDGCACDLVVRVTVWQCESLVLLHIICFAGAVPFVFVLVLVELFTILKIKSKIEKRIQPTKSRTRRTVLP